MTERNGSTLGRLLATLERPTGVREYTVWVGGGEVTDRLLTSEQAEALAAHWIASGYDDVVIEMVPE